MTFERDRTRARPRDLSTANRFWVHGYALEEPLFHIGGNVYSWTENMGYFLRPDQHIVAYRQNGELIQSWKSFRSFLKEEISRAEEWFPKYEEAMAKVLLRHRQS